MKYVSVFFEIPNIKEELKIILATNPESLAAARHRCRPRPRVPRLKFSANGLDPGFFRSPVPRPEFPANGLDLAHEERPHCRAGLALQSSPSTGISGQRTGPLFFSQSSPSTGISGQRTGPRSGKGSGKGSGTGSGTGPVLARFWTDSPIGNRDPAQSGAHPQILAQRKEEF